MFASTLDAVEDCDRHCWIRRLTAFAVCMAMALGLLLPGHSLAAEVGHHAAPAAEPHAVAEQEHVHHHPGGAGGHEVSGHCSVTGCFSALPSSGAVVAGPELMQAGRIDDQPPHLSPALKRDPPVPRPA